MTEQTCNCGRPTAGAWLCDTCETTFRWAIVNVGAHSADLGTIERKQARYGDTGATKGSIGKAQPLVVDMRFTGTNEAGSQLKYDTWATIVSWCRVIMDEQPEVPGQPCGDICLHVPCAQMRRHKWPANNTPSMIRYLARQFSHITSQQWAPDMFDEFLDLERRLTRMVDRPADRWYAGKCEVEDDYGTCHTELYAREDRGWVDCPGCGIRHDVTERRAMLLKEAREHLVTASAAARALLAWTDYDGSETKLVDRIRKWRDRELLEVADVTSLQGRDRHLYRLGDIQDLLVGDARNTQDRSLAMSREAG